MAFLLLGQPLMWSVSLAVLAGIATGWIVREWQNKELPTRQKKSPQLTGSDENKQKDKKENKLEKRRQRRYLSQHRKSWFFWKNPRRPPKNSR